MSTLALIFGALILVAVVAFLIGSIPFGYLIGRFFYRTDIRKQGSGNIGAMNALRTLGKGGAISVLLLDAAKGFIPVFVALHVHGSLVLNTGNTTLNINVGELLASVVGIFTVLGHCFSPWLGWKGGKGVATSFGAIFALSWPAGILVILAWVVGALAVTRYSSVGSMLANAVSPFALWFFTRSVPETIYGIFAAFFIIWTHRENLGRLRTGTENPIGLFKRKA